MRHTLLALGIVAALVPDAHAAAKPSIEQRLQALEARVQMLEAENATLRAQAGSAASDAKAAQAQVEALKAAPPAVVEAPATEPAPATAAANGNAFNPAISVILNGAYAHGSVDPSRFYRSGFPLGGDAGPPQQGFSLGESEVSLYANIDEKFFGQLTLTASNDQVGVENAYIETTSLPNGLGVRAGRFFSDIGYLNSHHAHTDNFYDRPLAYQAFLGGQYGDDGVHVQWLAPAPFFLQFGAEAFAGNAFPSGGGENGGVGVKTAFVKAGGDINDNTSWLAGLSFLDAKTAGADDGFSGKDRLAIADATLKWAPNGNLKDGGVTVRGEYLRDSRHGGYTLPADPKPGEPLFDQPWNGTRSGAYVEAVWRLDRTWELGYRFDKLWADRSGPFASAFDPSRNSLELSWLNSEFSLVRLQYSRELANPFDTDNVWTLQYQTALGAHGAHAF